MNSNSENRLESPDKPYIFLDIDEVLATTNQFYSNRKKWNPEYNRYRFDEKCVKVFNSIIEITNPIVILSSDWKDSFTIEQLNRIFEINGVNCKISDITPSLWGTQYKSLQQLDECRAEEILKYQTDHADVINKWVAIDDLNLTQWMPDNFVRCTKANEGIKQSNVKEKILKILI
jgi:hypothetical protein